MIERTDGIDHRAPSPWGTRRLWGLWDMLRFKAAPFYRVTVEMQRSVGVMRANGSDEYVVAPDGSIELEAIDPVVKRLVKERTETLIRSLRELHVSSATKVAERLLAALKDGTGTLPVIAGLYTDIDARLRDELEDVILLTIDAGKRRYFEPSEPLFGVEVATKFVGLTFEIDEAAKCLALGRPTAATFHLMRVMETAVRTVARCLQIPDPIHPGDRSWGKVLGNIKDGISNKWPTVASRNTGDGALFDALYASFDAAKNPWRNTTMHVESKYTDDEAEHIFVAVRGLMKRLASRMDEQGLPHV